MTLLVNSTSTGTVLSSFAYVYDNAGNRKQVTEADGSVVTWTYDPTYQLLGENRTGAGGGSGLDWTDLTLSQWSSMTLAGWLAMTLASSGGGASYRITHTYDPVGTNW